MNPTIKLFMWSFQSHFRSDVQSLARDVLKRLGAGTVEAECLLVGVRTRGDTQPNPVCVEPEDQKWRLELFQSLQRSIESHITNHRLASIHYTDARSMADKPNVIRREATRMAVQEALAPYDEQAGVRSFCGPPAIVAGYQVVTVLQVPNSLFDRLHTIELPASDDRPATPFSLVHAALCRILDEAHDELLRADPGIALGQRMLSAGEIIRRAGFSLMCAPGMVLGETFGSRPLFENLNLVSSLLYEGAQGIGRLLLTRPTSEAVKMAVVLAEPVPFSEARWARKILQMAAGDFALVADCHSILGLGDVAAGFDPVETQAYFEVRFLEQHHWQLCCGPHVLLDCRFGMPTLPQDAFPDTLLLDLFGRLFPRGSRQDAQAFLALFRAAVVQGHGSMFVVAEDAANEAERLEKQGTRIDPVPLTPELYTRVSKIDGTILVDPKCTCHAIGVILDGPARVDCTPARGARYNSGVRYVGASKTPRLAVVVSDDGTVDVIPMLLPRIRRQVVDEALGGLEAASGETYHPHICWLDDHRFYLSSDDCGRVNAALARINAEPLEVGRPRIHWREFVPDPEMSSEYFLPEAQ